MATPVWELDSLVAERPLASLWFAVVVMFASVPASAFRPRLFGPAVALCGIGLVAVTVVCHPGEPHELNWSDSSLGRALTTLPVGRRTLVTLCYLFVGLLSIAIGGVALLYVGHAPSVPLCIVGLGLGVVGAHLFTHEPFASALEGGALAFAFSLSVSFAISVLTGYAAVGQFSVFVGIGIGILTYRFGTRA
jgi:hypothetical protein